MPPLPHAQASNQPTTKGAGTGEAGAFQKSPGHSPAVPPSFPPWLSERSRVGRASRLLPSRPKDQGSQTSAPPGDGLGGRAQGTYRRSRLCAAAATCRGPLRRRAERPGVKHRRNRRNAGRREDSGEARGVAGAQAHSLATAPGSQERLPGGLSGVEALPRPRAQGPLATAPRASSASQLLPSPAVRSKSFRGHVVSAASSAGRSPGLRATLGGGWSRRNASVPASTSDLTSGDSGFPSVPFASSLGDFRSEVTSPAFLPT